MVSLKIVIKKIIKRRPFKVGEKRVHNLFIDSIYVSGNNEQSVLVVKTVNKPGVLEKISRIIAEENINISKVNVPETLQGEEATIIFLLDCNRRCADKVSKKLNNELRDVVREVVVKGVRDSYIFVPFDNIVFGDRRGCILTKGMIREIMRDLWSKYHSHYANQIMRDIGRSIGRQLYRGWIAYLEDTVKGEQWSGFIENALKHFADFYHALGYGWVEISRVGGNKFRITIYNNIICSAAKELNYHGYTGQVTAGMIAGYLQELLHRDVRVKEIECINKGSDKDVFEVEVHDLAI